MLLIGTNRYAERTKPNSDTNVRKELDFTMLESKKSPDFLLPLITVEGDYEIIFPKCDLYLMSEFNIKHCEEIKGNAVILTNQNTAYFIISNQIVMNENKPQTVQSINRQEKYPL